MMHDNLMALRFKALTVSYVMHVWIMCLSWNVLEASPKLQMLFRSIQKRVYKPAASVFPVLSAANRKRM